MTSSRADGYDSRSGGGHISKQTQRHDDLARLERAVARLVDGYRAARAENAKLRRELADREQRIGALDDQLLVSNQRRQDVGKRVDELISQLGQLEARFDAAGE